VRAAPSPGSLRQPPARPRLARAVALCVALATALSAFAVGLRFRFEPDVAALLPDRGEAAALQRYVRAFGGSDLSIVLVRGDDADENAAAAAAIAGELGRRPTVRSAVHRVDVDKAVDPMLVFRHADAAAQERLAAALTPEGMRARLAETKRLLLAPGSSALAASITRDPLRLAQLALENQTVGTGVRTQPDGGFSTHDGKMHLVLVRPTGQALRGADARAFVRDTREVMEKTHRSHPGVSLGLTGGHAIAEATEAMLTRDLRLSGTLSLALAAAAFALVFRRVRALVAVLPPLLLGTLWTAGVATALPGGVSAIAVAFMSVVVGVGVDTGVHVYAAMMEARREGLAPAAAAREARRRTARPVLVAAGTAALAFGALGLSEIRAVRQLGLLCAAGEVLTALAIVLVTPSIGAMLERSAPPPEQPAGWTLWVHRLTETRRRAMLCALVALSPVVALLVVGPPAIAESVIAVRPKRLQPLVVQQEIFDAFGGKKGQWVVLVGDETLERARERADRIADRLAAMPADVEAVDALTAIAPATSTQTARLARRDALDLPARADELAKALAEAGFLAERFAPAIEGMRRPRHDLITLADVERGPAGILAGRYLGVDGADNLVALYLRPTEATGAADRIARTIRDIDAGAALTGYGRLEGALRDSLRRDLPRVALVAGGLVTLALAFALRRARDAALAAAVVVVEIALVLLLIRTIGIPLHAYDALVLPVLLGITVDEAVFLLQAAREGASIRDTLRREGPNVAATALTTAAGFAALGLCDFDGLRDLGWVGALGSIAGLVVALVVVPAGLRLFPASKRIEEPRPRRASAGAPE
jgi:uncharacterized protein